MEPVLEFKTKEEAVETMLKALGSNGIGPFISMNLYKSEDEVLEFSKFYDFGGFNDENTYNDVVKNILKNHMDEIAEWLLSTRRQKDITEPIDDGVGFVIDANGQKRNAKSVHMKLRKDREKKYKFGFFISSCVPQ